MLEFDLKGKRAVVTGASRGLGQFMARALSRAGADLVVTARKKESCDPFVREIREAGGSIESYSLDVLYQQSIREFVAAALKDHGHIDILVNNAGMNIRKPFLDFSWDEWNLIMETNLRSGFFVTQGFAPTMIERGSGRVINIGSVTSVFGYAGIVPYCASRGGVLQMTKGLADELGPHGITVNCLAPGWFKTAQNATLYENANWLEYIVDRIPLKRPGRPDDLDGAVVFLASDASRYITGQIILVDGGITTGATKATV
jgi:NAD(P)-dependent dehydrogenase (short-subunit alcohol dehydrogenase family)